MTRTYMVQISLQNSGGKVVFSGGSMGPPFGHQRELKYLGHLSVKPLPPENIYLRPGQLNLPRVKISFLQF